MPDERQAFEVQEGEDESEKFPDASLACEAKLAAQSGQCRCHCSERVGDFVRTWYCCKDSGEKKGSSLLKYSIHELKSVKGRRGYT